MNIDIKKQSTKLILAGLAAMVDDEGMTAREALETGQEIVKESFWALKEMEIENRNKVKK